MPIGSIRPLRRRVSAYFLGIYRPEQGMILGSGRRGLRTKKNAAYASRNEKAPKKKRNTDRMSTAVASTQAAG